MHFKIKFQPQFGPQTKAISFEGVYRIGFKRQQMTKETVPMKSSEQLCISEELDESEKLLKTQYLLFLLHFLEEDKQKQ